MRLNILLISLFLTMLFQACDEDKASNPPPSVTPIPSTTPTPSPTPIIDTIKPTIQLIGDSSITLIEGSSYIEEGASASDDIDGNITKNILISGSVNSARIGTYVVRYNVKDSAGNSAKEERRIIHIIENETFDTTKPIIELIGDSNITLVQNTPYIEQGASGTDDIDGNITKSIVISGSVDSATLGSYRVHYNVEDFAGNQAIEVVRYVNVIHKLQKPWLNILLKFKDDGDMGYTPKLIESFFSNKFPGLEDYWKWVSNGKIDISGTKTLPKIYTLPKNRKEYLDVFGKEVLTAEVDADLINIIKENKIETIGYYGLNIFYKENPSNGASTGGASIDLNNNTFKITHLNSYEPDVIAHEMGHGYGLEHSTNETAFNDNENYEDYYSVMGRGEWQNVDNPYIWPRGITAYHKWQLELFNENQVLDSKNIDFSKGKTVYLHPHQEMNISKPLVAVLRLKHNTVYTVEAFDLIKYDNVSYGGSDEPFVLIRKIEMDYGITFLLSTELDKVYPSMESTEWIAGERFVDSKVGIVIDILEKKGDGFNVEITAPKYTVSKVMAKAVFNQAYQENYEPDTIDEILNQANYAYVLVDPFNEGVVSKISDIKLKTNEVGGYISAGTGEEYRDDFSDLKPYLATKAWAEWSDEFYISKITPELKAIMERRIDKMAEWGLDWVEFDNMDWLTEETREEYNLEATVAEGKAYINELCNYAHERGMKCMAKNSVDGFNDFEGVLYESSSSNKNWWDTEGTKSFLKQKKLVIINHYNEEDCDAVYAEYKKTYQTEDLSFICEDKGLKKYRHYNND